MARFGWEPSQPSSGGVLVRASLGKAGVLGSWGLSSFPFPFGAFRSAPERKGSVVGGTQRDLSSGRTGAGCLVALFALAAHVGSSSRWGSPLGGFWGSALGAWGFWPFSLSARPFSLLFGRKARSKRRRFGCRSANYRRLNGVALVALSSQSSPFRRLLRPGAFPSSYTRVGARPPSSPLRRAKVPGPPNFAASPCESRPGPPKLRRFAVEKSTWLPGFSLRHAKVHPATRFFHFAMEKFSASPWKSPPNHPVFRFAVKKFANSP